MQEMARPRSSVSTALSSECRSIALFNRARAGFRRPLDLRRTRDHRSPVASGRCRRAAIERDEDIVAGGRRELAEETRVTRVSPRSAVSARLAGATTSRPMRGRRTSSSHFRRPGAALGGLPLRRPRARDRRARTRAAANDRRSSRPGTGSRWRELPRPRGRATSGACTYARRRTSGQRVVTFAPVRHPGRTASARPRICRATSAHEIGRRSALRQSPA